jgi:hypothetical protein
MRPPRTPSANVAQNPLTTTYNLDLATEFRIAAELLQEPSGTSHPLQTAEPTGPILTNGTGGCWELMDQNGNVVG